MLLQDLYIYESFFFKKILTLNLKRKIIDVIMHLSHYCYPIIIVIIIIINKKIVVKKNFFGQNQHWSLI